MKNFISSISTGIKITLLGLVFLITATFFKSGPVDALFVTGVFTTVLGAFYFMIIENA